MRRNIIIIILTAFSFAFFEQPALINGSCVGRNPLQDLETSDLVFAGILKNVRDSVTFHKESEVSWLILHFTPSLIWKGPAQKAIDIKLNSRYVDDFKPGFKPGDRYLIYALKSKGDFITFPCARNNLWSLALFDRNFLSSPTVTINEDVTCYPITIEHLVDMLSNSESYIAYAAQGDFRLLSDRSYELMQALLSYLEDKTHPRRILAAITLKHLDSKTIDKAVLKIESLLSSETDEEVQYYLEDIIRDRSIN